MPELGLGPGPGVGEIISLLIDRVIDDPGLNTKDGLKDLISKMLAAKEKEKNHGGQDSGEEA